ncbi:MAG: hypothetical protein V4722_22905 [Bacteroidota bacterium]
MKNLLAPCALLLICVTTNAQVKIGGTPVAPHSSSILELDGGINKGFLLPRMTTTQIKAIPAAANGLVAYSSSDNSAYLRSNGEWNKLGFTLPFNDTLSNSYSFLFRITSTGTIASAIAGDATGPSGIGIRGSSELGHGVYGYSATGTGGYFTSPNGNALVTGNGNVGINTSSPDLARLVVNGRVGTSAAMFGPGNPGIVIETDPAGISFNSYNDGSRRMMDNGYSSLIRHNNTNGDLEFYAAPILNTANSSFSMNKNVTLSRYGNLGVGGAEPISPLTFPNVLGDKINFYESASAKYGIGLQGSLLQIYTSNSAADVAIGIGSSTAFTERFRFTGTGDLGIATDVPGARLHVNAVGTTATAMIVNDETPTIQLQSSGVDKGVLQLNGDDIRIGTNFSNASGRVVLRSGGVDRVFLDNAGNFSIGTTTAAAGYIFRVGGKMIAEEIRVKPEGTWPDYVFSKHYQLQPLEKVEAFIAQHSHLPNIPSAATVQQQGVAVGEMQNKLMEKVEELTLYLIKANKEIKVLQEEVKALKNK